MGNKFVRVSVNNLTPVSSTADTAPAPVAEKVGTTPTTATVKRPREQESIHSKIDQSVKRRRKFGRANRPRRDNRKSRFDKDFTGDDERHNAEFEEYYRQQGIVSEDEMPKLMRTLAIPLPSSFRIAKDSPFRESIERSLHGEMTDLCKRVAKECEVRQQNDRGGEDAPFKPIAPLKWYPNELAWSVSAPRHMLRRDNVLVPLHKLLTSMNEIGAINRQECVSMIPPLLLDVKFGHSVIDLCAAPGSKTAQILESILSPASGHANHLTGPGLVIANDADRRRCWMLAHQLNRFGSAELVVTQHEAQHFPMFMMFDRVLCDVPCSGDGTLRKAPDIWRRWNASMGTSLHRLQQLIVQRGVEILKPGGRLVYSTCSMNPVENEAVVAHVLRKYRGDVELIDCSDQLPGLIRRPGLTKWYIKDHSQKWKRTETRDGDDKRQETESKSNVHDTNDDQGKSNRSKSEVVRNSDRGSDVSLVKDVDKESVKSKVIENSEGDASTANAKQPKTDSNEAVANNSTHMDSTGDKSNDNGNGDGTQPEEVKQNNLRPKVWDPETPGWFTRYGEVPHHRRAKIVPSMFHPSEEELNSGDFPLQRCMRLVPHDQDTGAFFVAVFHKKTTAKMSRKQRRELEESKDRDQEEKKEEQSEPTQGDEDFKEQDTKMKKPEETDVQATGNTATSEKGLTSPEVSTNQTTDSLGNVNGDNGNSNEKSSEETDQKGKPEKAADGEREKPLGYRASQMFAEDALVEVQKLSPESLNSIIDFYGLNRELGEQHLMTRGADGNTFKKVVAVSSTALTVIRHGVGYQDSCIPSGGATIRRPAVRIVNAGVRVLERTDRRNSACRFRIVHDGVGIVRALMPKRVFEHPDLTRKHIIPLLKERTIKVMDDGADGVVKEGVDPIWKKVLELGSGSSMIVCENEELVVWIGLKVVDVAMAPDVIKAMLTKFEDIDE